MKKLVPFYSVISFIPIITLIVFYSFTVKVFFKLGHLPSYNYPDPKFVGFNYHYKLIDGIFFIYIPVIIIWVILSVLFYIKKIEINKISFGLCSLSMIIFLILFILDPKHLFEWFMD
jgi:hypothetical protein